MMGTWKAWRPHLQELVKINGNRLPQKELFQKMNNAFDGKINVLQVSWHNGTIWLCSRGWRDEAIWWKVDDNGVFARNHIGWEEIITSNKMSRAVSPSLCK